MCSVRYTLFMENAETIEYLIPNKHGVATNFIESKYQL